MMAQNFALGMMVIYLVIIGISIYSMVLFIKLARRGIKALDIYIENNKRDKEI